MINTNKRALKTKDRERLNELHFKHPGDLTDGDKIEMERLEKIRAKYGDTE